MGPPAGNAKRPFRVGLTGGIASGKSSVAKLFEALGVPVIDTDELAREVVAPGAPGLAAITVEFGTGFLDADGRLDRRRLRAEVFARPEARERLEAILHPLILEAMEQHSAKAAGPYQVLVIPLLVEKDLAGLVDRVLVVDCPENQQRTRLEARDGETPESAQRLLDAQASRPQRLTAADDIIDNSGDPEALPRQVRRLHDLYLRLAAGPTP